MTTRERRPARIRRPWRPSSTCSRTPPRGLGRSRRSGCARTTGRRGTGRTPRSSGGAGSRPGGSRRSASSPGDRVLTLVPVDARAPRRVLRRDVRGPRVRPARRPDGPGHRRPGSSTGPARPPAPRQRPRRPRPARGRARAVPHLDRRGPVRRPGRHVSARLGGAARGLAAPEARRHLRARVHVGHDRQPQGRDPHPRQRARRIACRSTGSSTRWSTGSCRCSPCRTRSSRPCRCTTRSTSAPTSSTSAAGTRG